MSKRGVGYFAFPSFFVLLFVMLGNGVCGLDGGDSLIVANFSGMPGDTVVDSVIAVNTFPVAGLGIRLVFPDSVLSLVRVDRGSRVSYFKSFGIIQQGNGWVWFYGQASAPYDPSPPLDPGGGSIAEVVFTVSQSADSGQVYEVKLENKSGTPPMNNEFIDTLNNTIFPRLKNGMFTVGPDGVDNASDYIMPKSFSLDQNSPNPFNATTAIGYQLSAINNQRSAISLRIYNIPGQLVRTLIDERQGAGNHSIVWDGRNGEGEEVGSGVYIYRLRVGSEILSKKMVLLK